MKRRITILLYNFEVFRHFENSYTEMSPKLMECLIALDGGGTLY